jgi:hypothetical protein
MIPAQTVPEVIRVLEEVMYKYNFPHHIASDSGSQLLGSPVIRSFLHQCNVTTVRQISWNVHSHGVVEAENKTLRALIKNNLAANFLDLRGPDLKWTRYFHPSVFQLNTAPRKFKVYNDETKGFDGMFLSPMEMLFGRGNPGYEQFMAKQFNAEQKSRYQTILRNILRRSVEMQKLQQQQRDDDRAVRRPNHFNLGQLVLYRLFPYDKNKPTYRRNIFTIISIRNRKVILSPVYGPRRQIMAHIKNVKRITNDPALINKLPASLRKFFVIMNEDPQAMSEPPTWLGNPAPIRVQPKTRAKRKAEKPDSGTIFSASTPESVFSSVFQHHTLEPDAPDEHATIFDAALHKNDDIIPVSFPTPIREKGDSPVIINSPPEVEETPVTKNTLSPAARVAKDLINVNKHVKHLAPAASVISTLATPPIFPVAAGSKSESNRIFPTRAELKQILPKIVKRVKGFLSPAKLQTPILRRGERIRHKPKRLHD